MRFLPVILALAMSGQAATPSASAASSSAPINASGPAEAAPARPLTLQPGEQLVFRISWGVFGKAGEVKVSAVSVGDSNVPRTEVVVQTASAGFVRALYAFDGEARSLFDPHDGRLLSATATTRSKRRDTRASITLDHQAARATYVDHVNAARNTTLPLPDSRPMDFVTSLIEARAWSLRPGDRHRVSVLFDDEFYDLTLHARGYETIRAEDGRREALLVTPSMEENPRGLFRRGGEVRVWLDRRPPHLPLRFEVKTKSGTATGLLTRYQPPPAPTVRVAQKNAGPHPGRIPD